MNATFLRNLPFFAIEITEGMPNRNNISCTASRIIGDVVTKSVGRFLLSVTLPSPLNAPLRNSFCL